MPHPGQDLQSAAGNGLLHRRVLFKRGFALATALAAGAAESAEGVPPPWGRGTLVKRTPLAEQATQDRSIG